MEQSYVHFTETYILTENFIIHTSMNFLVENIRNFLTEDLNNEVKSEKEEI